MWYHSFKELSVPCHEHHTCSIILLQLQIKLYLITVLLWNIHSASDNKSMNELLDDKKKIEHTFRTRIVFSYIYCSVITLVPLKKTTQLMFEGCFWIFTFSCTISFLVQYNYCITPRSTFFSRRSRGILGCLILIFLELSHGVRGVLVFL
jgi:hypothetical protein